MALSEFGEVTACPSTLVMTSPAVMPTEAAGVPQRVPRISVPLPTGAMVRGTPAFWSLARHCWPDDGSPLLPDCWLDCCCCCCCGLLSVLALWEGTSTPMNPEGPILTVELLWPLMIW